jgi:hypothetical protein
MVTKDKIKVAQQRLARKPATRMSLAHMDAQAQEYKRLQEEDKKITKKIADINKELKDLVPGFEETTTDDKENQFLELPSGIVLKLEKRLSTALKQEEAILYAKRRGLSKKLIYTQEVADSGAFEALTLQGIISDKDYEELIERRESVALKIQDKKDASK